MLYTKEFYSVMENFEKYAKQNVKMGTMGLTREDKKNWKRKWYYSDGLANEAFKQFLAGYMLGKTV